jgi:glycine hydroxymethyltransferase
LLQRLLHWRSSTDEFRTYAIQLQKKCQCDSRIFYQRDYDIISGGTDNHMILIDLRNKGITGKEAENALVKAGITVNKNMVPFDDKSPFVTSGIRIGTPAITTRGLVESDMEAVVDLIDKVIMNYTNDIVRTRKVGEMMQKTFVY